MSLPISITDLSKSFQNVERSRSLLAELFYPPTHKRKLVIDGFTRSIPPGSKVQILGKNGTGKTTLLKLIAGLLKPSSGSILVGNDIASSQQRSQVGIMFSNRLLYISLSGFQNLEFSAHLAGVENITKELERTISQWQLETFVDDLVETYSQGQRTLLALARAVLGNPPLVLLDEPSAFLDESHKKLLRAYLTNSDSTVIYTLPAMDTELPSDEVIHL